MIRFRGPVFLAALALVFTAPMAVRADEPSLADFFGFENLEVVKIDRGAGPVVVADMNADGLEDLIVINNFASRIEVHYQKKNASPDDEVEKAPGVNKFPDHWRFRREFVSVTHQVQAVIPYDFNGDGLMDFIYAGNPAEIVFVKQSSPGVFEVTRRHSVKGLNANRNALAAADVRGDEKPELISLVNGKINIWPLTGDNLGQPLELSTGSAMVAFAIEDYNGDGRLDIAGIIPDDSAPARMWLGSVEAGQGTLGPQISFEMPPLHEFEPVHLPGESAARIATIERPSKRIVLYELTSEPVEQSGDRDAALTVFSFNDSGNRKRDTAIVDVDGDGLMDLVATDTEANALVVYRQLPNKGLQAGESNPSLSDIGFLAAGNVDGDPAAELFVLSEKEGVVGRCDSGTGGTIPFPEPLSIPDGNTPVAMNLVELEHGPHVAVVAKTKSGRDYDIYLIDMQGDRKTISLGSQSRSPDTILGLDADQDGRTDLLLLTRDKPMTMLHATADGFKLLESKDMGQFGLVQAANALNTDVFDIDGNGQNELLIADKNYVRAVRYVTDPEPGVSPGWQVVEQINAKDPSSKLVSVAILGDRIIAADKENSRLVVMARSTESGEDGKSVWKSVESVKVRGFAFNSIHSGAFSGDGKDNILAIGDSGFAVINLGGDRVNLKQFAAWRTDEDRRIQHELTVGDVNNDGFTDMVSLDAGEQMCEIFTFSEADRMLYATGFKVYESKLFSRGDSREFQPSQCIIADVTGDGRNDLVLLCHDRVLIYPQMTKASAATP
jgi:hypothetical protein